MPRYNAFGEDAVLGCDFTSIVERVGKNVSQRKLETALQVLLGWWVSTGFNTP